MTECLGLTAALELLKDIADKYGGVSYADLFQIGSAVAIEVAIFLFSLRRSSH